MCIRDSIFLCSHHKQELTYLTGWTGESRNGRVACTTSAPWRSAFVSEPWIKNRKQEWKMMSVTEVSRYCRPHASQQCTCLTGCIVSS
eukprot:5388653-Amphidinium_carterae.2